MLRIGECNVQIVRVAACGESSSFLKLQNSAGGPMNEGEVGLQPTASPPPRNSRRATTDSDCTVLRAPDVPVGYHPYPTPRALVIINILQT